MKYTIECDGILYGPFATDREAADWALSHARGILMDRNEVEHVARVSGKEAAQETLLGLGIDTAKPIETQRDFAHLRWWREIAEGVMKAAVIAMALGFGGTLATLVWLGFKISLSQ